MENKLTMASVEGAMSALKASGVPLRDEYRFKGMGATLEPMLDIELEHDSLYGVSFTADLVVTKVEKIWGAQGYEFTGQPLPTMEISK